MFYIIAVPTYTVIKNITILEIDIYFLKFTSIPNLQEKLIKIYKSNIENYKLYNMRPYLISTVRKSEVLEIASVMYKIIKENIINFTIINSKIDNIFGPMITIRNINSEAKLIDNYTDIDLFNNIFIKQDIMISNFEIIRCLFIDYYNNEKNKQIKSNSSVFSNIIHTDNNIANNELDNIISNLFTSKDMPLVISIL